MYIVREVLHTSSRAVLYRGRREGDGAAVVIKALGPQHRPAHLERLRNEYAILKNLAVTAAVKPIALESYQGMPALVLEDFGGQSIDQLAGAALEVGRFLRLAIGIAAATADIHARNVVHKDLKPENILVEPSTGEIKIADFGIAAALPCQRPATGGVRLIEGSLPYMSPEQTGRTNRALDQRSDLYSLGVTFYQLLTGQLPFVANDPLEWVHCHVACAPVAPREVLATIPPILSSIILKLLAKEPDERYQSARGLRHDLERCLVAWTAQGKIEEFPLGERDIRDRLQIPQRLYGRDQELSALLDAFARVVEDGTPELVLVAGHAGIGKSSLVHELQKPIVRARGFFATGKFDQFKRDIPYSTILEAFTELVLEILSGSDEQIGLWRERLQAALGKNGQLVVDVIPPAFLVIGPQPPVPALPPAEAQNRFRLVFRQFIGVFASAEHPLALFLDDLQWADQASLALLQDLMTHPDTRHLFVVGAYRDNEVPEGHPLLTMVGQIQNASPPAATRISNQRLEPLGFDHLESFLADTLQPLHAGGRDLHALAELVLEKTGGNPFFAIQFLGALKDQQLIEFDSESNGFKWDMARIRAVSFTDNVVELMVEKLRRLPDEAQAVAKQLACLGGTAEVATLALLVERPDAKVHDDLAGAVRAGLILRVGNAYKFLHDRVQEAAYSLIPPARRAHAHVHIGRQLLASFSQPAVEEKVFDVVNQLNRGTTLITDQDERDRLCRLNFLAGRKAKAQVAYGAACGYLAQAAALLPGNAWSLRHEETFTITLERAECEYLIGNFQTADDLFNLLLDRANSHVERARVYSLRTRLYQVSGRYGDALAVALEALRLFDVNCPSSDQDLQRAFLAENREITINMRGRSIAELAAAPMLFDPTVNAIIGLLVEAMPCAYITRSQLFPLLVVKAMNFSLHYGNTVESCFVYSSYSIMLIAVFGDIPAAYAFSQMSLQLNANLGDAKLRGTLLFMHASFVNCWRRHLSTSRVLLDEAMTASLEVGDLVYAGFNAYQSVWQAIETGDALDEVLRLSERYSALARKSHNDTIARVVQHDRQFIAALKGQTSSSTSLTGPGFDAAEGLSFFLRSGFGSGVFLHHLLNQILACLFESHDEALVHAARAAPYLGAVMGTVLEANYHFYQALSLAAQHRGATPERQAEILAELLDKQKKFALWAQNCPENHACHHALISAEIARLQDLDLESTTRLYDRAIRAAAENGLVHKEALGNECAAGFLADRGFDRIAGGYLTQARSCYLRWGADAKVERLELLHPQLRERRSLVPTVTFAMATQQMDVMSVVKASQAISSEIVLDALLGKLIRVLIEQAGAQRGYVLLRRDGDLVIAAEARVDGSGVPIVKLLDALPAAQSPLLPGAIINYVWRTKQKILLEDAAASRFADDEYVALTRAKSVLCLPIARQSDLVGLLYLENNLVTGAFSVGHLELLELLVLQAAISLQNAQLLAREQAGRVAAEASERQKAFLAEASVLLSESLDHERVLHQVAGLCVRDLADWCVVDLLVDGAMRRLVGRHRDAEKQPIVEEIQRRYPPRPDSPQPTARVIRTGVGTLLPEPSLSDLRERCQDEEHFQLVLALGTRSGLCVPLLVRGQTIGALTLGSNRPGHHFDRADLELATELASRAALAIDNARLHHEAIEALRLREDFLSVASHELYTPLASLNLVLETLAPTVSPTRALDTKVLQKSVDLAKRQGSRLSRLIGELLDVSRLSTGRLPLDLAEVDLTSLVREILERFAPDLARARCPVEWEDRTPVVGHWDRSRLDQVIANLLSNAIKFGCGKPIALAVSQKYGVASLRVTDHGIGMEAAEQPRIFDRFRRGVSSSHYGGLGLGLYICRGLVEAHGGSIRVESSPGKGATFTVELPSAGPQ